MITRNGVKMTANRYAKEIILDRLDSVLEGYWVEGNLDTENIDLDYDSKTFGKNLAPRSNYEN